MGKKKMLRIGESTSTMWPSCGLRKVKRNQHQSRQKVSFGRHVNIVVFLRFFRSDVVSTSFSFSWVSAMNT